MSNELSTMVESSQQLALLAHVLEQRSNEAIKEQQSAGQTLRHAVDNVRNDVSQLIHSSGQQVAQLVKQGIDTALIPSTAQYERTVNASTAKMEGASRNVEKVLNEASSSVHRQIWVTYGAIIGAIFLLISGGGMVLWIQWQSYNDARTRTAAAQVDAELMEAFNQISVTSCGGRPCVKLDQKSPRWGNHGEYVLIDTAQKQK